MKRETVRTRRLILRPLQLGDYGTWFEDGKWGDHLIYVANPEDIGLKARKPF